MSDVVARIAAWEAAGLIDRATADRLRAAESEAPAAAPSPTRSPHRPGAFVGPNVTIPEVFGYLGTAFLLAAWTAWTSRGSFDSADLVPRIGPLLAAVGLIVLGLVLRRGDARRSRAAGVAFLVGLGYLAVGVAALIGPSRFAPEETALIVAGVVLAVAVVLRAIQPAVLTQIGLLAAVTGLAGAILIWLQATYFPSPPFAIDVSGAAVKRPDPLILLVLSAAWWLASAAVIGLIGLRESIAADRGNEAAARRAALSQFWAGLLAVAGLASAVTHTDYDYATDQSGRVLVAWLGELSILVLALILLERAFRRDSTAYVYSAALGMIVALTDFNFTYLSGSTEVGLAIEGAILLAVGLAADRLRRRIGRAGPTGPGATLAAAATPAASAAAAVAPTIEDLPPAGAATPGTEVPPEPDPAGG